MEKYLNVKAAPKKRKAEEINKETEENSSTTEPETKKTKNSKYSTLTDHLTESNWKEALQSEYKKPYFKTLIKNLEQEESKGEVIYPPIEETFAALNHCPLDKVKVVILGQDPYFNPGQGHGLSFSVRKGVKVPPSLKNIYKELETDIEGFKTPDHGCLESWSSQGVLLLNATLTVRKGKANSHEKFGWQTFTDEIIKVINKKKEPVVFLLWGGFAQKKGKIIDNKSHKIINSAHPSPLAGNKFQGSKCFSQSNEFLSKNGIEEIDWKL
jgi:uracil-DNA glycosylase